MLFTPLTRFTLLLLERFFIISLDASSHILGVRPNSRALRRLQREQAPPSPYLFTTERRTPMSAAGFRKQLAVIGVAAGLPFPIHPHMLRHACGFALAHV